MTVSQSTLFLDDAGLLPDYGATYTRSGLRPG